MPCARAPAEAQAALPLRLLPHCADTNVKSCKRLHSLLTGLQAELKREPAASVLVVLDCSWVQLTAALHAVLSG